MAVFSRAINVEMDWIDEASFEIRGTLDDNARSVEAGLAVSYRDFAIQEASGGITRMPYPGYCQGAYVFSEAADSVFGKSNDGAERSGTKLRKRGQNRGEIL